MLSGNKTYIAIAIGIIYIVGGKYLHLWPVDGELLASIGLAAGLFLRLAISKTNTSIDDAHYTIKETKETVLNGP
jgi:hypothetical protein